MFDGAGVTPAPVFDISSSSSAARPANAVYSYSCVPGSPVGGSVTGGAAVDARGTIWSEKPPVVGVDYRIDTNPNSTLATGGACGPIAACPQ